MHLVENDILIPEMGRLLKGGQQVVFTPGGVSMRPFIEGGRDTVILEYPQPDTIRVGDILLCKVGERFVLHRLISIEGDTLRLKGDGNITSGEICRRDDVIGRVIGIRTPKGRKKRLTRGRLWHYLSPVRKYLLKVYRKLLKLKIDN